MFQIQNIPKLSTREDAYNIHKTLGIACFLNFVYRYTHFFIYGNMGLENDAQCIELFFSDFPYICNEKSGKTDYLSKTQMYYKIKLLFYNIIIMMYDVCIIGGGQSGLVTCKTFSEKTNNIIYFQ